MVPPLVCPAPEDWEPREFTYVSVWHRSAAGSDLNGSSDRKDTFADRLQKGRWSAQLGLTMMGDVCTILRFDENAHQTLDKTGSYCRQINSEPKCLEMTVRNGSPS